MRASFGQFSFRDHDGFIAVKHMMHLFKNVRMSVSAVITLGSLLTLSASAIARDKSALAEFAGKWVPKPNLCGKEALLDNEFPFEISKDGMRLGRYESSCDVVKVKKIGPGKFTVRQSCEEEGQPTLSDTVLQFADSTLIVDGNQKFHNCNVSKKTQPAKAAKIIRGYCSMDVCSFYQVGKVIKRQKTRSGELLQVTNFAKSVHVPYVEGVKDQYANVKVPSFDSSNVSQRLVHCSKQRPFSAVKLEDGKWFGELLNLPVMRSMIRYDSTRLYWAICHNVFVEPGSKEIKKLGYNWEWPTDSDQIEFESMYDMIVFAKR